MDQVNMTPARTAPSRDRATLEEVAELAGVSGATASRVMNGSSRVATGTRRAVEQAARRLGYVPNQAARSLVTRRSDSVGLVIPEPAARLFGDPFFPRLVRGITETLSPLNLQLVLFMPQSPDDEARLERYLAAEHVDGVLLVSLHGPDPLPVRLARRGVPVVLGGRLLSPAALSRVDVDNVQGAVQAVQHLTFLGRRAIATIAGPQDMGPGVDRLTGYRHALELAGRAAEPDLEQVGDFTYEGGVAAMRALLERRPDLDAVFVASELMAVGAMAALRAAGRRAPDDVAVVGFDDSALATTTDPPLTSVRQPIELMGREMARLLLQLIGSGDRTPQQVVLGTELVVRASTMGAATPAPR
jgi:DNA-binding LacI/PurR family transcriptional regulator